MQLIENASSEKLRGGYYTPREIADFILRWGLRDSLYTDILEQVVVMEPSLKP